VRNSWPLGVIEGSGGFADEVSAAVRNGEFPKSAKVSEIASSGSVSLFNVDDTAEKLKAELRGLLWR